MITAAEALDRFRSAMRVAGIEPPDQLVGDGMIHRFGTNGRADDDAGWYVLHLDGLPAGAFGCWRSDISQTWRAAIGRTLSLSEKFAHSARISEIKAARKAEEEQRRAEARKRAAEIWKASLPALDDYAYLVAKAINAHGVRVHYGRLMVPMYDASGELHSLQFIDGQGGKRFLTGGRVGACYYTIGKPDGVILIAEGFATGATLHEATGLAVAVAFNAGNLAPVAKALRGRYPDLRLIVCADDDNGTEGNPGLTKTNAAAFAVGAAMAVPDFGPDRPAGVSDFNDLARLRGLAAVKACVEAATMQRVTPVVEMVRAIDIQSEPIRWPWPGWLACGKLHVIAGPAGTGKTTIALDLAATVTTGGAWPDGTHCQHSGHVLIWSAETASPIR